MNKVHPANLGGMISRFKIVIQPLAVLVYIISILASHYNWADNLGLFSGLSWMFYLSVALLLFSFLVSISGHDMRTAITSALMIQIFFSLSGFLVAGLGGSQPNFTGEVGYFVAVNFVLHNSIAAIIPHSAAYGGWPVPLLLYGSLLSIVGVSSQPQPVLIISQIGFSVFDFILMLAIVTAVFGKVGMYRAFGVLVYSFGGHYIPAVLDDIGLTYTFFLLILLVLLSNRLGFRSAILILLSTGVVLSNFYASMILGAVLLVAGLVTKDFRRPLAYFSVLLFWLLFGFPSLYVGLIQHSAMAILNVGLLFTQFATAAVGGSLAHHTIVVVTITEDAIFAVWAIILLLVLWIRRLDQYRLSSKFALYIFSMAVFTIIVGPAFSLNPIESLERAYFLSFPLFVLMISNGMGRSPSQFALILLIILAPLSIITMYGPVVPTYVSPAQESGGTFLEHHSVFPQNFYALVPTKINSPAINTYYFTDYRDAFESSFIPLNYSDLQSSMSGHASGVYALGHSTRVYISAYTGSVREYELAQRALASANLVYSSQDILFYYH
jgi:hypothetical protein